MHCTIFNAIAAVASRSTLRPDVATLVAPVTHMRLLLRHRLVNVRHHFLSNRRRGRLDGLRKVRQFLGVTKVISSVWIVLCLQHEAELC